MRAILLASTIALFFAASPVSAEDFPTDRDLQASYCVGSDEASMALPGDPQSLERLRKRRDHFWAYLMVRLHNRMDQGLVLTPAQRKGKDDIAALVNIGRTCELQCPFPDATNVKKGSDAEARRFTKALGAYGACRTACREKLDTGGLWARASACEQAEKSLPF
jgi:hypothetical protein